jgi:hypothetical protein
VHSRRLEQLGDDRATCSGEIVVAHWLDERGAKASASESLGTVPEGSVVA